MNVRSGAVPLKALGQNGYIAVIHGGAGPADPRDEQAVAAQKSIMRILDTMTDRSPQLHFIYPDMPALSQAECVVLNAVQLLEKDPLFNAGLGAALQADGQARLSASYMESSRQKFSSVTNITDVMHPSELAYYLQSQTFSSLDSDGAKRLAKLLGIAKSNLVTPHQRERWQQTQAKLALTDQEAPLSSGTVGCVSIDAAGHIAVITSTGGVGNETVGRIGDTPTTAGNYCSQAVGISCTGIGEQIINEAFAAKTVTRVTDGMPIKAAIAAGLSHAAARNYHLAAIALELDVTNAQVHWVAGTSDQHFTWGVNVPQKNITSYKT